MPSPPCQPPREWPRIGVVAGPCGTDDFTFYVEPFKCRIGDLVAVATEVPSRELRAAVAGIGPIDSPAVVNFDVTSLAPGHLSYAQNMEAILRFVGLDAGPFKA